MDLRARDAALSDAPAILAMMIHFNRHEAIAFDPKTGEPALRELLSKSDLGRVLIFETDRIVAWERSISRSVATIRTRPDSTRAPDSKRPREP